MWIFSESFLWYLSGCQPQSALGRGIRMESDVHAAAPVGHGWQLVNGIWYLMRIPFHLASSPAPANPRRESLTISMFFCYFWIFIRQFICTVPGHAPPPLGGHHGDVSLDTCVLNLGSGLRPVARAPARGGVRAWPLLSGGPTSKMLIFASFIRL